MRQALALYQTVGVSNNVDFLARLVAVPSFANADLDTGLIEREQALLFPPPGDVPADVWLLTALAEPLRERRLAEKKAALSAEPHSPWRALDGWRLNGRTGRRLLFRFGEAVQEVGIEVVPGAYRLTVGAQQILARGSLGVDSELQAQLGERRPRAAVVAGSERRHVFFEGRAWPLTLVDTLHVGGAGEEVKGGLRAPMPGKVIALAVKPGSPVEKCVPHDRARGDEDGAHDQRATQRHGQGLPLRARRPGHRRRRQAFLCTRFTAADISLGYALLLAQHLGLHERFTPFVMAYWQRLQARDGFQRAMTAQQRAAVAQNVPTTPSPDLGPPEPVVKAQ